MFLPLTPATVQLMFLPLTPATVQLMVLLLTSATVSWCSSFWLLPLNSWSSSHWLLPLSPDVPPTDFYHWATDVSPTDSYHWATDVTLGKCFPISGRRRPVGLFQSIININRARGAAKFVCIFMKRHEYATASLQPLRDTCLVCISNPAMNA